MFEEFMVKYRKWKRERMLARIEKHKRITLEQRLHELEKKHGRIVGMEMIEGALHYFFIDGAELYFMQGFGGIEIVYVEKGLLYNYPSGINW